MSALNDTTRNNYSHKYLCKVSKLLIQKLCKCNKFTRSPPPNEHIIAFIDNNTTTTNDNDNDNDNDTSLQLTLK